MDFPDNPVVKTLCFQCKRMQVPSLVWELELRSHMLETAAQPKKSPNKQKWNKNLNKLQKYIYNVENIANIS